MSDTAGQRSENMCCPSSLALPLLADCWTNQDSVPAEQWVQGYHSFHFSLASTDYLCQLKVELSNLDNYDKLIYVIILSVIFLIYDNK